MIYYDSHTIHVTVCKDYPGGIAIQLASKVGRQTAATWVSCQQAKQLAALLVRLAREVDQC